MSNDYEFRPRKGRKGRDAFDPYPHGEQEFGTWIINYIYKKPVEGNPKGQAYAKVARYEIQHEDGTKSKRFPQYVFRNFNGYNDDGPKNWEKGEPDEKIPYFLPHLVEAAPDAIVAITEGEKDAESAVDIGLVGTCNSGGAAKIKDGKLIGWAPELNQYFVKRHVVLFEDNDYPGRVHVQTIARQLKGVAAFICVVRFRDFDRVGFDLSDFVQLRLDEGKSYDEIREEVMSRAEDHVDLEDTIDAEELLERAANDPGAAFEPEIISGLARLKIDHPGKYETLRAKLKASTTVRVGELDKLVVKEVAAILGRDKDDRSQSDILIELANEAEFFHTADSVGFAVVQIDEHKETWAIGSKGFKHWLTRRFYQETERAPSSESFQASINVLEAKARIDAPEKKVHVRVGGLNGRIYIDLCDSEWRAIEIAPDGWRIVNNPPVRFRRAAGMKPLPVPTRGGSVLRLKDFLNVASDDDFILAVAFLLMALKDDGPYVILALLGGQGAAKSTFATILRRLTDPNVATLRTLAKDDRDLAIAARNGHIQAFDNVSSLSPWLSDALCRLATGSGFATRKLYEDDEEAIFDSRRPVILNGIDGFITRPDLSDRCVTLTLPKIAENKRRPENEMMEEFEGEAPRILGALLDVMAHGLRELPKVSVHELPRMADFFKWITACEGALWPKGSFARAYEKDRECLALKNVEADNVANTIRDLIDESPAHKWEGTTENLLEALNFKASSRMREQQTWPNSARGLSSRLARIIPPLWKIGIQIETSTDSHTKRSHIRIVARD